MSKIPRIVLDDYWITKSILFLMQPVKLNLNKNDKHYQDLNIISSSLHECQKRNCDHDLPLPPPA